MAHLPRTEMCVLTNDLSKIQYELNFTKMHHPVSLKLERFNLFCVILYYVTCYKILLFLFYYNYKRNILYGVPQLKMGKRN